MAEVFVYVDVKLWSIINYDRLRNSKPADNNKLGDVLVFDGGKGFHFYPSAKVVNDNQR